MDDILHHLRNLGNEDSFKDTNKPWFQPWFHFVVGTDFATIH